jgi:hypothetical protein
MATTKNNDAATPEPPAEPTAAADPAAPVPDAGGEPVKQATAATARPIEPMRTPTDYEMPDDYETDWLGQTRRWVEENPAIAVVAAAGAGLVIGRLVMALFPDPEPPGFSERVEQRAKQLRKNASGYADDAGDVLATQLKKASEALADAAEVIAEKAEIGYEKSKDLAEVVADAAKAAVAGVVAQKADSWLGRMRR